MYCSKMFAEKVLEIFRLHVESKHDNNMSSASRALGVHITTLEKWLKGTRDPGLSKIGPVMDKIGVQVSLVGGSGVETLKQSVSSEDLIACRARITELEAELVQMRTERDKALGAAEVLRDMIEKNSNHSARDSVCDPLTGKPSSSNSRTG